MDEREEDRILATVGLLLGLALAPVVVPAAESGAYGLLPVEPNDDRRNVDR